MMPCHWLFIGEAWHDSCSSRGHCSYFSDTGDGFAASGSGWDSLSIRHAFIRKVHHTNLTESATVIITFESRSLKLWDLMSLLSACVFRCIWFWHLSSLSPRALWPYSHLCEYTEWCWRALAYVYAKWLLIYKQRNMFTPSDPQLP